MASAQGHPPLGKDCLYLDTAGRGIDSDASVRADAQTGLWALDLELPWGLPVFPGARGMASFPGSAAKCAVSWVPTGNVLDLLGCSE